MNNDGITGKNEVKVETSSDFSIHLSQQPIDKIEENCSNEEESSDGSSPSALKKRLQDLSSTYDNIRSIDPLTPLSRRIPRINRSDKEEHQHSNLFKESSVTLNSLQGARARRRAKIRSEILHEIDKSLSITNPKVTDLYNFLTQSENASKLSESSMESLELTKICDNKGSLTSRSYCKDDDNYDDDDDDEDNKKRNLIQRQSKSANEDRISKCNKLLKNKIELNPISHLSANNVRQMKCGGYRPHTGIILKNLSSSSESESINETTSNCLSRKINNPITNTELSSPISRTTLDERILLSVLSPRSIDNQGLSSFRSFQEIPQSRIVNNNDREKIEENDLISMPSKSGMDSSVLKTVLTNKEISYTGTENDRKHNDRTFRETINSIDETNISKHQIGGKIEHRSCPSSAKTCIERDNDFISLTNSARYFNEGNHSSYGMNNKEKIPSFLSVGLIQDLETLNVSDNERQENTSVPSLRLYSEDVSCSTSAGSKTYTQNRSLDSSVLSNTLSNVCSTLNARDKENNSTITRCRSFDDNEENLDTSLSSDQNLISIQTREEPSIVSGESKIHKRYNEFKISEESRRAFSAPSSKLPTGHLTVNDQRCKSVDLPREMIYVEENLRYPESFCSTNRKTNFSESTGSLNFVEEYQTFNDPLVMSYLQEENMYPLEYLTSSIYPRQSHLSILQEESETRLEENGLTESNLDKKDSSIINYDKENINRSESIQQIMSTTSSKNRKIEQLSSLTSNETNLTQNTNENSMKNQWDLKKLSSNTNLISICSTNKKPDVRTKQDDKLKDLNEEGDNEYKKDKSSYDKIDRNNLVEGIGKDFKSLVKIDENARLESLKSVRADTTMFIIQNVQETCTISPKVSCSTSRLHRTTEHNTKSPRFKNKKSQDRFPFTMSETENTMLDTKHDNFRSKESYCKTVTNKSRSLETFRELTYPTIAEFLNVPNECYAYSEHRQDQRNILPKMKGLVRRFSNKFKSVRKHNNNKNDHGKEISTKIIYQNQECQIESIPESFSDESIIEESQLAVPRSGNTKSSIISSGKSLKKTMSLENLTLFTEYHPRRRYDRDDRWVKEFQECSSQFTTTRTSSKERCFSIFASKSESSSLVEDLSKGSSRLLETNIRRVNNQNENSINVSISSALPKIIDTKINVNKDNENSNIDEISINLEESGCICLKLYRILTCSLMIKSPKNRTSYKRNDSLIEMKKKKRKKNMNKNKKFR
ncbi:hypothetical protein M0802_004014 [Mischocyttarus mexicanus]|nr:hypothetical protein M0802_004014 [Mischocyttarus mexicanus]